MYQSTGKSERHQTHEGGGGSVRRPLNAMQLTRWLKFKSDEMSTSRYRAWSMESRACPCIVYLFLIGLQDLDMCTT